MIYDFDVHRDHLIPAWKADLVVIEKKKRTCYLVGFNVPAHFRVKMKALKNKDYFLYRCTELKNWSWEVQW